MKAGMSVRGLARKAGVSFALLTCIENARRGAGRSTLERLGAALALSGDALENFILDGLVICKRERVLKEAEGFPARVLNALALALRRVGVVPEIVAGCETVQQTGQTPPEADLVVYLKGGRRVNVAFKIAHE